MLIFCFLSTSAQDRCATTDDFEAFHEDRESPWTKDEYQKKLQKRFPVKGDKSNIVLGCETSNREAKVVTACSATEQEHLPTKKVVNGYAGDDELR